MFVSTLCTGVEGSEEGDWAAGDGLVCRSGQGAFEPNGSD